MNASIVRWTKTHTLVTTIICLCLALVFLLWQTVLHTVAQGTAACPSNYIIGVSSGSVTSQPIGGVVPLAFNAQAQVSGVTATNVDFYSTTVGFLGTAVKAGTGANGSYWNMPLYTQLLPNAAQTVYATVSLSDGGVCNSAQTTFTVSNGSQSPLKLSTNPASFTGQTNSVVNFSSSVTVDAQSVLPYSKIDWTTTVGSIDKTAGVNGAARLFSGPLADTGHVSVTAKYGGKNVTVIVPITVISGSSTTDTSGVTSSGSVTATSASTQQTTSTSSTGTTAELNTKLSPTVQDCAIQVLGLKRTTEIKQGTQRPNSTELEKLKPCFAQANYIVPNNFAPVAPAQITELPTNNSTKIADLSNTVTDAKIEALKISGTGKANSIVMLYVFSEPLVIATSTDAQGNWSYTLEDPLVSGKHEVYAVVNTGAQYEKTNPFTFVIGKADASAKNPGALSLKLENDSTPLRAGRSISAYLIVFGSLFFVCLVFSAWLYKRWSTHNQMPPPVTNSPV